METDTLPRGDRLSLPAPLPAATPGKSAGSLGATVRSALEQLAGRLFEPVDPASLVAFRAAFGLLLFGATVRFWALGWIFEHYQRPKFFFKYHGFEWVSAWPGAGMQIHFALMAASALFIALGLFYRASAATFCVLFTYAHLIDKTHYLNHYHFVSLVSLLLVFLPLHRAGSLDRRLGLARGPAEMPRWALWLIRFQVGVVYFFGGVAKLRPDWLFHAQPLTIWLGANTDFPLLGGLFRFKATAYAMSWAGAAFDLSIPFLLLMRRTRPFAFVALVLFHALTGKLFPIGVFPWVMSVSALIFFSEGWPRRFLPADLAKRLFSPPAEPAQPRLLGSLGGRLDAGQKAVLVAVAVYALLQIGIPLRRFAYPGDACWTEQGFRFSWNVMLVEKNGDVEITALDPKSGKRWAIDPRDTLLAYQIKQMSTQPDMILEFCRSVAEDFRKKGYPDIEVRAQAYVAYNGRPPAPLLDATVDLGRERDGLAPYRFLRPAPDSLPGF